MCDNIFTEDCSTIPENDIIDLAKTLDIFVEDTPKLEICKRICQYITDRGLTKENFINHITQLDLDRANININDKLMISNGKSSITKTIVKYFDVTNINPTFKRLGNPSSNGTIVSSTYNLNGMSIPLIIKQSLDFKADNIYYEYLVGRCINKLNTITPFF